MIQTSMKRLKSYKYNIKTDRKAVQRTNPSPLPINIFIVFLALAGGKFDYHNVCLT